MSLRLGSVPQHMADGFEPTRVECRRQAAENRHLDWQTGEELLSSFKPEKTKVLIDGRDRTSGTTITMSYPLVSRVETDGGHGEKTQRVVSKLKASF